MNYLSYCSGASVEKQVVPSATEPKSIDRTGSQNGKLSQKPMRKPVEGCAVQDISGKTRHVEYYTGHMPSSNEWRYGF